MSIEKQRKMTLREVVIMQWVMSKLHCQGSDMSQRRQPMGRQWVAIVVGEITIIDNL